MNNIDINIEITNEKIFLTCEGKNSSYKLSSKNPQKSMIARIVKLTGLPRKEVGDYLKAFFLNYKPPTNADYKPATNAVEKIEEIISKKIDEKFEEHAKKMEEMILRLLPVIGSRPVSITTTEESMEDIPTEVGEIINNTKEIVKEEIKEHVEPLILEKEILEKNNDLDIRKLDNENKKSDKKNEVIRLPKVLLGFKSLSCEYDIEKKKLYNSRSGKEIGTCEYLRIDDDAFNEGEENFNYDSCLAKGEIGVDGDCIDLDTGEKIILFKMDLDKITMDELGEYHANFKDNPIYCSHNVEQDNRYIDYIELGFNWDGWLYHTGQRDDLIKFI